MALPRGVVRRARLIDGTFATAPGHRAGDGSVVVVREAERREPGVDERAPDRLVVLGGARDEVGAPPGQRVQVVEGAKAGPRGTYAMHWPASASLQSTSATGSGSPIRRYSARQP